VPEILYTVIFTYAEANQLSDMLLIGMHQRLICITSCIDLLLWFLGPIHAHLLVLILVGASCIAELLMTNSVLEELSLKYNSIGDDGIIAIAKNLNKSVLSELNIVGCQITLDGALSLAAVLVLNQRIHDLHMHYNPITVEGARVILQSAINRDPHMLLFIDDEYETDSKVSEMMKILKKKVHV